MDATAAKHDLRHACLATLRAVPAEQRERFSTALRAQLRPLLPPRGNVALYAPLPHEVDLMPLLTEQPDCHYFFPCCLPGRKLQFQRVVNPGHELVAGAHGIPAPRPECPAIEPQEIDLLVVPGVAFTTDGARLGHGGGYYDRFIPLCTKARLVALAFPWQIVPAIPTEPHDLRVPLLVAQG